MGAVALREERRSLTIDSPLAIADLCSEMRFLDREYLRVVLLNAKQHLIKVCTVSQDSVNESLAHPREVFKPAIVLSAYSFIMVHNHPSGVIPHPVLCRIVTGFSKRDNVPMRHKTAGFVRVFSRRPAVGRLDGFHPAISKSHDNDSQPPPFYAVSDAQTDWLHRRIRFTCSIKLDTV